MKREVFITDSNCITPLGFDVVSNMEALSRGRSGIQLHKNSRMLNQPFYAAIVNSVALKAAFAKISDNNDFTKLEKMLLLALAPIVAKQKITSKTAFLLSTTKGNISTLENKNNPIEASHLAVLAKKISSFFGFKTEPIVVSNACVSGIMAIAVAKRMIQSGIYDDAVIVAGDLISEFVLSGFNSFQAMSELPCKPYDKDRNGVTLGEATAAVYMTSDSKALKSGTIKVIGDGAINDANHISGPSRTGEGLFQSIENALQEANIDKAKIDYISAHGTATPFNDEMEAVAFNRLGLNQVPVNSLKGFYGHTLGTSGLLETVIAMECASQNQLLASKGYKKSGVSQPINIIQKNSETEINYFLKTASGFGGCNTAVLFEKVN